MTRTGSCSECWTDGPIIRPSDHAAFVDHGFYASVVSGILLRSARCRINSLTPPSVSRIDHVQRYFCILSFSSGRGLFAVDAIRGVGFSGYEGLRLMLTVPTTRGKRGPSPSIQAHSGGVPGLLAPNSRSEETDHLVLSFAGLLELKKHSF